MTKNVNRKFLFIIYENGQNKFGETEIGKHKFHKHKNQIWIFNVDVNKICNKFVTKLLWIIIINTLWFTKVVKKIRPLFVMHLKINAYKRF